MRSSIELARGRRSGSARWYDVRADPDRFSFEDSRIAVLRVHLLGYLVIPLVRSSWMVVV